MPNDDYIKRSDALKAVLGVSIYDTLEELDGARTISGNTWVDGLYDAFKIIEEEVDTADMEPVRHGRWVSVTIRFPETRKAVLVWQPQYRNIYTAYWDANNLKWYLFGALNVEMSEITYWLPLPEPPKEDDDGEDL